MVSSSRLATRHASVLCVGALSALIACGEEAAPPSRHTAAPMVTVTIDFAVPAALSAACPSGDPGRLGAALLVDTTSCALTVSGGQVQGSCDNVIANRSVDLIVVYEETTNHYRLAEQVKRVAIPGEATSPFAVDFAGVTVDEPFADNLDRFCAGTL